LIFCFFFTCVEELETSRQKKGKERIYFITYSTFYLYEWEQSNGRSYSHRYLD